METDEFGTVLFLFDQLGCARESEFRCGQGRVK